MEWNYSPVIHWDFLNEAAAVFCCPLLFAVRILSLSGLFREPRPVQPLYLSMSLLLFILYFLFLYPRTEHDQSCSSLCLKTFISLILIKLLIINYHFFSFLLSWTIYGKRLTGIWFSYLILGSVGTYSWWEIIIGHNFFGRWSFIYHLAIQKSRI